jgi:Cu2+-exporting ATPase
MNTHSSSIALLDDRQEWLRFSEAHKSRTPTDAACVWDSHVVIEGMHCAACAFTVEEALLSVPGVQSAEVNAATHRAKVVWDEKQVMPSQWMQAVARVGYGALPAADSSLRQARYAETRLALWRMAVAGFCMMQVMMYVYPTYVAGEGEITPDMINLLRWAAWVLSLPVMFFSCGPFFSNALRDVRLRQVSMDLPVAIGMLITFALSTVATFEPSGRFGGEVYFDSLTMFVFFLLTGRWMELRARDRTAGALEALMNRLPESVERRLSDGSFERVAVRRLLPEDVIRVLPGESFPADGVILEGRTQADEALLTGESRPQSREVGDPVVAGSHNLSATVLVRVEQVGQGTKFSQIVALMEDASLQKPRLAQLADRVAKPFLLGVLIMAALSAAWWWSTSPSHALMIAVAVLVVTCPCALSLATPAAMLAAAGKLAKHGVLVRNLQALEGLASIDTLIFDKTGTLTQDGQRITGAWVAKGWTQDRALQMGASLAKHSLHPLSRALALEHENQKGGETLSVTDLKELAGQGLEAWCGQRVLLGSLSFSGAQTKGIPEGALGCQVHLCTDTEWLASWALSEDIRPDAAQTVQALKELGLQVRLLSGDRPSAVAAIARKVGIDQARGGCQPEDKLAELQTLQAQGAKVAMVGDGLNDGPVLAGAHVSMVLGHAVPLAQSKSDLVLMGSGLSVVVQSIRLARQTLKVVKQNLLWAAVYNAVCVPLAVVGWLPAWLAGLGMALSSLLVVLNALRLTKGS